MKPEKNDRTNRGLEKTHTATRIDPVTGETIQQTFTQQEWIDRDKSLGFVRDDDGSDDESTDEPADDDEA